MWRSASQTAWVCARMTQAGALPCQAAALCFRGAKPPAHLRTSEAEQGVGAVRRAHYGARLQLLHDLVCLGAQQAEHAGLGADVCDLHLQRAWVVDRGGFVCTASMSGHTDRRSEVQPMTRSCAAGMQAGVHASAAVDELHAQEAATQGRGRATAQQQEASGHGGQHADCSPRHGNTTRPGGATQAGPRLLLALALSAGKMCFCRRSSSCAFKPGETTTSAPLGWAYTVARSMQRAWAVTNTCRQVGGQGHAPVRARQSQRHPAAGWAQRGAGSRPHPGSCAAVSTCSAMRWPRPR